MKVDRYWVFSAQSGAKVTLALVSTIREHQKLYSGVDRGNKSIGCFVLLYLTMSVGQNVAMHALPTTRNFLGT